MIFINSKKKKSNLNLYTKKEIIKLKICIIYIIYHNLWRRQIEIEIKTTTRSRLDRFRGMMTTVLVVLSLLGSIRGSFLVSRAFFIVSLSVPVLLGSSTAAAADFFRLAPIIGFCRRLTGFFRSAASSTAAAARAAMMRFLLLVMATRCAAWFEVHRLFAYVNRIAAIARAKKARYN